LTRLGRERIVRYKTCLMIVKALRPTPMHITVDGVTFSLDAAYILGRT